MTKVRNNVPALVKPAPGPVRPPGTGPLVMGLVAVGVGVVLWPLGLAVPAVGAGGVVGVLVGLVLLLVGLIQRLLGGPGRPVDRRRVVLVGAAVPLAVSVLTVAVRAVAG